MATKWKKSLSVLSLFLGIWLAILGGFGTALAVGSLVPRGLGPADALKSDYQNTAYFRREMSALLYHMVGWVREGRPWSEPWDGADTDINLLFYTQAAPRGTLLTDTNTTASTLNVPARLPEGYNFLLVLENGKVTIYKDGEKVDVYGNGYYTGGPGQWQVPGYVNFDSEGFEDVTVRLAAAARPQDMGWDDPVGGICRVLSLVRMGYIALFAVWVLDLVFWALACRLRGARREARAALARRTGKLWFEVKLAAVLLFPLLCLWLAPRMGAWFGSSYGSLFAAALFCLVWPFLLYLAGCDLRGNHRAWRNSLCVRLFQGGGAAVKGGTAALRRDWRRAGALMSHVWFELVLLALVGFPIAVFFLGLAGLDSSAPLLGLLFWALGLGLYAGIWYLTICLFRYQPKPWRHSLFAVLGRALGRLSRAFRSAELRQPLLRRFLLRGIAAAAGILPLALAGLAFFYDRFYVGTSLNWLEALVLALLPTLLLLAPLAWLLDRGWLFLRELAALTGQLSVLRAGTDAPPLSLSEGSELSRAAQDLNSLQDGMRAALEDRMKSERMKVELIANVSHDLKTPLTSVISYAELLSEEEGLPPHVQDYIRILNVKAKRLSTMVQDVFEVSKAASGELPLRLERLDLNKLLRQTLADMDEAVRESGLTFRVRLPDYPVWLMADGDRLYRVFQNLIQNALQYSLEGSRVYLTLASGAGKARVAVKNTSRSELPAGVDFTERFTRGDKSRTDGGSGLGLAIASSFAAACGGTLQVETDADLFTVEVSFPVLPPEA